MNKLVVSNINFTEMLACEDALGQLSPDTQLDSLNAFLFYNKGTVMLIIKEAISYAHLQLQAEALYKGDKEQFGIAINYHTLFYVIHTYSEENRKTLRIEIDLDNEPHFKIIVPGTKDTLALPNMLMTEAQVVEIGKLPIEFFTIATPCFELDRFETPDEKKDFINGIFSCMPFISEDEKRNNAFAIYNDKIIVNDRRHIFIYMLNIPIKILFADYGKMPVSLHKKAARIMMLLTLNKVTFNAAIEHNEKRVYIKANNFTATINNSMSNISPPSETDLNNIRPENPVSTHLSKEFLDTSMFFNGFYKSNMEFKPLTIGVEETGLRFILKDSGISGYNSSNIERFVEFAATSPKLPPGAWTGNSTIMNDSFLKFLKQLQNEAVTLYMDSDHKAVYLDNIKRKLYMAKLQDK